METPLSAGYQVITKTIEELYDSFDHAKIPGGYAAAVICEGQVIFKKAYGFANHEYQIPFTTQTIFDFASVAKQFTGYCMAILLRQETLSIEDDIRQFIPEIPDYGQKITIRHLLGHTSGLRDWYPMIKLAGYSENDTISLEFLMNLICRQKSLNFEPGSRYAYSNSGYFILAKLIQRVTGKSLREYADEKIFKPLGMHSTFIGDDPNEIITNRAYPYLGNENKEYGQGVSRLSAPGCSSLFSNLEDMVTWMQHIDTCVVNKDGIFDMMLQPTPLNDGRKVSYNFGIAKGRWRERVCLGHGGGWNAFACDTTYFPEERTSIIFMSNRSPNHVDSSDAVRCILFNESEDIQRAQNHNNTPQKQAAEVDPATIAHLHGQYYSPEIQTTYRVQLKDGHLILSHMVNEDVLLLEIEPGIYEGDKYWCKEINFTWDEDKKITGFLLGSDSGNLIKNVQFCKLEYPLSKYPK